MSNEDRLVRLLDDHHAEEEPSKRKELEGQILALVDEEFRRALKPGMEKMFGNRLTNEADSLRYTAMVHDFYVKMLEKRPDEFWKARTFKDLCYWSSRVLTNQILNCLQRRKTGEAIAHALAPLIEDRQARLLRKFGIELSVDLLELIESWRTGDDLELQSMGAVITYHYLDGFTYEKISDLLGIPVKRVYRFRHLGIERLQSVLA